LFPVVIRAPTKQANVKIPEKVPKLFRLRRAEIKNKKPRSDSSEAFYF
jgi:hypothetical protein